MPTPVGHALAGAAVAIVAERSVRSALRWRSLLIVCMALAVLPDLDLLYQPIHRSFTHSLGSVLLVMIVAAVVTGKVTRRSGLVLGLVCAAAWGSHIVLDWLGTDPNPPRGIKALWPFSNRWFISGWDLFLGTERRRLFTGDSIRQNLRAIVREILVLAPVVGALAFARLSRRWGFGEGARRLGEER
jgi:LexA-binding, inner membrane-associated putative hydrolase